METEWERVLAACRLLEGWVVRGLALGFVATLTLELTSVVAEGGQTDFHKSLRLYRAVAGASLLACAAVYVAAGLLCLGRLKRGALATCGLVRPALAEPVCMLCLASPMLRLGSWQSVSQGRGSTLHSQCMHELGRRR